MNNIIENIKAIVLENAKKGELTTTKYVGPYNYKSGFDNYFAMSLNKKGEVIVYSFYENDRGEHISTGTIELTKLSEKVLNEVYENINTEDEDILSRLKWYERWEPELFTHNTDILVYLGIIKPKKSEKKETYKLDLDKIPELANKKDAYYINRNHEVGLLKYIGDFPDGFFCGSSYFNGKKVHDRLYSLDGKKDVTMIGGEKCHDGRPHFFSYLSDEVTNKGCFKVLDNDRRSNNAFIFVPNKEILIDLFERANDRRKKYLYVVNANLLCCFKSENSPESIKKDCGNEVIIFTDKDKAIAKFDEIKNETLGKLDSYIRLLEDKLPELNKLCEGHEKEKYYETTLENLKVGDQFVRSYTDKNVFTIRKIDEYGAIHVDNGVMPPHYMVLPCEHLENVKIERAYKDLRSTIYKIEGFVKNMKERYRQSLEDYTPFIDEGYLFSMKRLEEYINELLNYEFAISTSNG